MLLKYRKPNGAYVFIFVFDIQNYNIIFIMFNDIAQYGFQSFFFAVEIVLNSILIGIYSFYIFFKSRNIGSILFSKNI